MLQIAGSPTCSSERVRELQENTTCFINKLLSFLYGFYTCTVCPTFHEEIIDRIYMRKLGMSLSIMAFI
jgi:hypothetical protein